MKNLKKVTETAKKSAAAKTAAGKKAALAKRAGTVSAKGVSAKTNRSITMATKKPTPKKAATPEPETGTIDREQLLALGEELNKLLFEGNEVEYEEMDDEALEAQIRQDCTEIDPKDAFTDEAKAIIAELDIEIEWAVAKKPAAKTAPAKAEKAAKAEKPAKEKKAVGEKRQPPKFEVNQFGHRKGTMTDIIDQHLVKGTTAEKCAEAILKAFPDKTKEAAMSKFGANVKAYIKEDAGKIVRDEKKGTFKFAE